MIELILAGGVAGYASLKSRKFVRERLRFGESVQKPAAPGGVGVARTLAVGVLVSLPFVPLGAGTAVLAGVGIGVGVRHGAKDSKRLPAP